MTKAHPIEKDVKRKGKELLAKHGWFVWMPPANTFGKTGISDLHAVKPGVFMVVEFKIGDGKPTGNQKAFLTMISEANHFAFVVSDQTMPYFESWLSAFDRAIEAQQKNQDVNPDDGALMLNCIQALTEPYADMLAKFRAGARAQMN